MIDQDTPVAASQPATDASSQEVSKPKRSTTTRSKAKPAAKSTSGKTAPGKTASQSSESTPAKDSSDSKGGSDSKAAQAESASSKTTASKTAKGTGRSAGKTAKTTTAKAKKTANASKEISGSTADAVAPKSAAATAAEAPKTAGKTAGKSSAKTPGKAPAKAAGKTATPRKGKATEASATEATATVKTAEASDSSRQEAAQQKSAAPQKPAAARAPKGRPAKAAAKSTAQVTAPTIGAAPTNTAPKAASPTADKPAASAALTSPAPVAQATAKTAELSAKQPAEQISDKPADAAPRQNAPAAERAQSPRQAAEQNASQTTDKTADQTEQGAEQAAESGSAPASGEAAAGDGPRRKNRRGRRGGRGRNRKKELNGQDDAQAAEDMTSTALLDDDDEALDLPDDAPEQASRAQDTRPQNAPRQNKPAKQARPQQQQQQQNKPENGKPAENSKSAESNKPATAANAGKAPAEAPKGRRRMFISVLPGEQVEVALAEDGQLLEYYLDMLHQRKIKGNIYKGVIHNIDTNLQAAFVSYGAGKNGFLQIDEVHPEYWLAHHEPSKGKKFPPIQKVLKAGQEVLVQVVKEPTGSKGAFLTTWLSLAGRFLVLTPGQDQIGVSRKVDDDEERSRLREMMNGIDPGQGLGVIVRTVSAGTTKTTLKNDLQYLKRVWRDIRKKATEVSAPTLIYQEPGLSERAVRDYLTEDVCEIWVDNDEVAQSVRDTVNLLFPRRKDLVRVHTDMRTPMWERFNLRRQLEQIYSREVLLPSGGRLVFDQTEALMAIDINSGKISGKGNFEAMAHKTNMEAAEAIARHLKLRDIGGQVVIDFIEMRDKKHVLEVEKTLRTAMKNDRARHDVARMSSFGLLELVRQRTGSSALAISLEPCPACGGTGMRRNIEWQALQALRELRRTVSAEPKEKCVYPASPELALYLLNHKRDTLREIEQDYGKCLEIMVRP